MKSEILKEIEDKKEFVKNNESTNMDKEDGEFAKQTESKGKENYENKSKFNDRKPQFGSKEYNTSNEYNGKKYYDNKNYYNEDSNLNNDSLYKNDSREFNNKKYNENKKYNSNYGNQKDDSVEYNNKRYDENRKYNNGKYLNHKTESEEYSNKSYNENRKYNNGESTQVNNNSSQNDNQKEFYKKKHNNFNNYCNKNDHNFNSFNKNNHNIDSFNKNDRAGCDDTTKKPEYHLNTKYNIYSPTNEIKEFKNINKQEEKEMKEKDQNVNEYSDQNIDKKKKDNNKIKNIKVNQKYDIIKGKEKRNNEFNNKDFHKNKNDFYKNNNEDQKNINNGGYINTPEKKKESESNSEIESHTKGELNKKKMQNKNNLRDENKCKETNNEKINEQQNKNSKEKNNNATNSQTRNETNLQNANETNLQNANETNLKNANEINIQITNETNLQNENNTNVTNNKDKNEKTDRILQNLLGKLQQTQDKLKIKLLDRLQKELQRSVDVTSTKEIQWSSLNLSKEILLALEKQNFLYPSPVQEKTIPLALKDFDVIVRAKNGTGKTLSYVVPILEKLIRLHNNFENQDNLSINNLALIIVPTRELAMQVGRVFRNFEIYRNCIMSTFGGSNYHEDILRIERGISIIIGTPGRILDLSYRNIIKVREFKILVFDEADKILAVEFKEDIERIVQNFISTRSSKFNLHEDSYCPVKNNKDQNECNEEQNEYDRNKNNINDQKENVNKEMIQMSNKNNRTRSRQHENDNEMVKQIMLFSATFPVEISPFVAKYMQNPQEINLMPELHLKGLSQFYIKVETEKKLHCLKTLLKRLSINKAVIFCNSVLTTERLGIRIMNMGFSCFFFHSRMSQDDRKKIFHQFTFESKGETILVATDLITRGIDVPEVNAVINFDFPRSVESFLHRIGRAGRFGSKGVSVNLVDEEEMERMIEVEKQVGMEIKGIGDKRFKEFEIRNVD